MNNKRYFLGIRKIYMYDFNKQIRFGINLYYWTQFSGSMYYPLYSRPYNELNNISEKYILTVLLKYDYNENVFFEIKQDEFENIKNNNLNILEGPTSTNIKIINNKIRFNSDKEYIIN